MDNKFIKEIVATNTKKRIIELETDIESIQTHIKSVEWEMEGMSQNDNQANYDHLFNQRRRSLDKLREIFKELKELRMQLVDEDN